MSREVRPCCPKCSAALVYQPSIKSFRCHPCRVTYTAREAIGFKKVEIEVVP